MADSSFVCKSSRNAFSIFSCEAWRRLLFFVFIGGPSIIPTDIERLMIETKPTKYYDAIALKLQALF
jgi:hypothetical protein